MNMTPQEIAKEYREAKDKGNQIKILADENLTDRKEIIKILREQGEITDKVPRSKGLRAKAEPGAAVEAPESVIAACERAGTNAAEYRQRFGNNQRNGAQYSHDKE